MAPFLVSFYVTIRLPKPDKRSLAVGTKTGYKLYTFIKDPEKLEKIHEDSKLFGEDRLLSI